MLEDSNLTLKSVLFILVLLGIGVAVIIGFAT